MLDLQCQCFSQLHLNPKQAGLFVDWLGRRGGGTDFAPLCNFCLNGPINLKFGM